MDVLPKRFCVDPGDREGGIGRSARWTALLVGWSLLVASCFAPAAGSDEGRLHALLVNGGGTARSNYHSHLMHLRSLLALLDRAGVPRSRITVLASDGADPTPDLAVREEPAPERSWLLPQEVARPLQPPIVYANSTLEGIELRPATRATLTAWFAQEGSRLRAGDTLLIYVTDHGKRNEEDPTDNTIVLWNDERLGVRELTALRAGLPEGVRVVLVMSQCFSGSFANAVYPEDGGPPDGTTCGYFSVPADRPAYGCYPEAFREIEGHGHRFFQALERDPRLPAAHRETLETDRTPDVPLRSSDVHLERLLREAAGVGAEAFQERVDGELARALAQPQRWEAELRLLDRLGESFGFSSPRSLQELRQQTDELERLGEQLKTYSERWNATLEALRSESWRRFLEEHPEWQARLAPSALQSLDWPGRRALAEALLGELGAFTERQEVDSRRLEALRWRAQQAHDLHYRTNVRLGVLLRMRGILQRIAGRHHLAQDARPAEREAFAALAACEDLSLGTAPAGAPAGPVEIDPFPPLWADEQRMAAVSPAWLGINYRPVQDWEERELPRGSVEVLNVYEGSPAQKAGIQAADVILGPPAAPFSEPHAIREWVMRSEAGRTAELTLRREGEGEARTMAIELSAYPISTPAIAGRPKPGSRVPELRASRVAARDAGVTARDVGGGGHARLLFFFATWCQACERAVPELLAFSKARGVDVVAISDEGAGRLEAFLRERALPFPEVVLSDPKRADFRSFGVSGTPTLVLLDAEGTLQHYQVGYHPARGIEVPGWSWTPPPAQEGRTP